MFYLGHGNVSHDRHDKIQRSKNDLRFQYLADEERQRQLG